MRFSDGPHHEGCTRASILIDTTPTVNTLYHSWRTACGVERPPTVDGAGSREELADRRRLHLGPLEDILDAPKATEGSPGRRGSTVGGVADAVRDPRGNLSGPGAGQRPVGADRPPRGAVRRDTGRAAAGR